MNPITIIAIGLAIASWISKKQEIEKRGKIITDLRSHRDRLLDRLPKVVADEEGIAMWKSEKNRK